MDNGNYDKGEESQDNNVTPMTILFDNLSTNSPPELSSFSEKERKECSKLFEKWHKNDQTNFVQGLLTQMTHFQHSQINFYLSPMLQRDFISLLPKKGLDHVAEKILGYLDGKSLCNAELVCKQWHQVISERMLWKKLIEHNVKNDYLWRELSKRRGWANYLFKNSYLEQPIHRPDHWFYRRLYPQIIKDITNMEKNWRQGIHTLQKINCRSEVSKGVYCLQYDDNQIISGLRDNTIKIWSRSDLQCKKVLTGHTGSVLCLQFDENVIVSGSSDATVRVWDLETGNLRSTLIHHSEAVLHLRFSNGLMVTCSKDRSIVVWEHRSPVDIVKLRVLVGHRAAVNVVDFDEKYIVSASGDRTIKVWDTNNCEFVRTLIGHKRGIACLQYRDKLVVSGSSDNTIRLWDVELGVCIRVLEGHEELVRCIRFDNKRIVSGAYDGKIKVWDLEAALDPKSNEKSLCLKTLIEHTGRVFRLQFDQFQIVSSSHDDTILIWDFLDSEPGNFKLPNIRRGGHSNGNSSNGNHHHQNSTSSNGTGAKLQKNSLSNGSANNNGFGNLSPTSSSSSSKTNSDKHMENNMIDFYPSSSNADKPMQNVLNNNDSTSSIVNPLDQEMTNSSSEYRNEFQQSSSSILQQSQPQLMQSPVHSSNENQQRIELMDTRDQKECYLGSPSINTSNQFNNFIISQQQHSTANKQSKLANITNLTTNSTKNAELNSPNASELSNNFKTVPVPMF